jgi:uncharacterized protein YqjF (DUF2071 family)
MASSVDLMNAEWRYLAFLNYEIEPGVLEQYLPDGVELDRHHGRLYLSLVGSMVLNARIAGIDDPLHGDLEQVSLRVYVRRPLAAGGFEHGVANVRQLVSDTLPALGARGLFNERAAPASMRHAITMPNGSDNGIGSFEYEWATGDGERRQWHRLHVATHGRTRHVQTGSAEEFLTQRHYGFSGTPGLTTLRYRVEHPGWRIWPATRATLECDVKEVFGRDFEPYMSGAPALAFVAEGSDVAVHLPKELEAPARA